MAARVLEHGEHAAFVLVLAVFPLQAQDVVVLLQPGQESGIAGLQQLAVHGAGIGGQGQEQGPGHAGALGIGHAQLDLLDGLHEADQVAARVFPPVGGHHGHVLAHAVEQELVELGVVLDELFHARVVHTVQGRLRDVDVALFHHLCFRDKFD